MLPEKKAVKGLVHSRSCHLMAVSLCLLLRQTVQAQTPGSLDSTFDPGSGAIQSINCALGQADGKVILGGNFYSIAGAERHNLARLNIDGSIDDTFDPGDGADNVVFAIVLQPDGKLIVGGLFSSFDHIPASKVTRLNKDGTVDTSFSYPIHVTSDFSVPIVRALAVQPDGKLIIGGFFSAVNGFRQQNLARLNSDGSLDSSFDLKNYASDVVARLVFQPDGQKPVPR